MKQYNVTIRAIITKTLRVEAENEDEATQQAHDRFSVLNDDTDESYEQDCIDIEQAEQEEGAA